MMARTITALFDSRPDAEVARGRLEAADIDVADLYIADKVTPGFADDCYSTRARRGFWATLKGAFLPDDDRHAYEEGVRRGGYLLSGEIDDDDADAAVRILDTAGTVDIDRRAGDWKARGWEYPSRSAAGAGAGDGAGCDEVVPGAAGQVRVGRRVVDRGGVRVRSYVVETPVSDRVAPRAEQVTGERRAVDRPLSTDAGASGARNTAVEVEHPGVPGIGKDAGDAAADRRREPRQGLLRG